MRVRDCMDVKSGVEEKRVKSTIIRRRTKAEAETPTAPQGGEPTVKAEETAAGATRRASAGSDVAAFDDAAAF